MVTADWVLLVILLLAFFIGWRVGTIRVVGGIGALILGYQVARGFSSTLAVEVTKKIPSLLPTDSDASVLLSLFIDTSVVTNHIVQIVIFLLLFVFVFWLVRWIAGIISKAFRGTFLGSLDSILGAFLCLLAIIILLNYTANPGFAKLFPSVLAYLLQSQVILPFVYSLPTQFLSSIKGLS